MIITEVYSNCSEIELFLNGISLGKKKLKDFPDHIYKWPVAFETGELVAVGIKDGKKVKMQISTTGGATDIALNTYEKQIFKNKDNILHIVAKLIDENGKWVKNQEATIEFKLNGLGKILGVDNGAADNVQTFQNNKIKTNQGRALLIVQLEDYAKEIEVIAMSKELKTIEKKLTIRL